MNNIYKVIWSKAKNCYVVASEIARSHTKSASGSEKIGGVTRRSLLASLMALSLLCGGLGVASAVDVVHVDESASGGIAGVYTTTKVDALLDGKADKTALDGKADKSEVNTNKAAIQTLETGKANTSLDNLSDAGKAVIKTTMTDELAKKADATALDGKANTSLDNLSDAGKSVIKDTMAGELAKKADATDVNNALSAKADKTDLDIANGKITDLQKKTVNLSDDGKKLKDMITVSGATVSGTNVEAGALKVTGAISDGAGVNTTLVDINDSMTQTATNKADIATLQTTTNNQQTAIDGLNTKTTKIDYDAANDITSVNGMKVGQQVDMGGKDIINARALTATGKVTGDGVDAGTGAITGGSLTVTGKVTGNGVDAGAGDITTRGKVKGDTLETTGNATIGGALTATGKVTGDGVAAGTGAITGGSLTVTGKVTGNGVDAGAGAITGGSLSVTGDTSLKKTDVDGALTVTGVSDLQGDVILGTNATNTVTVNGIADFNEAVNMDKGLTVTGATQLENTTVTGDLKVTGTITTDQMVFGDPATGNYTEINKGNITSKNAAVVGDATLKSSSMELDHSKLEVAVADKDSNGHLTMTADKTSIKNSDLAGKNYSEIVADKDSVKTTVKDEEDNTTSTKSSATEIRNYAKDAAGNKTINAQTATQNKSWAKDKDGNESSIVQTGKDITNTAEKGTITSKAKDIVNDASGNISNKSQTMDTTVTGKATESYGELETTVNGKETHNVTGTKTENVTGKVTENYNGGQETNVTGDKKTTVTGKTTEEYKGGLETTVTGDEKHTVTGNQTTNVTGNISNTAKNITNEANEMLTDKVGTNTRVTTSTSITDTVGTTTNRKIEDGKITDTAGDSTVVTENEKGTTFTKTGSTAFSTAADAPMDTNIAGNHITTGRVDANELGVSDKDGDNSADLSVKAGEGVKASASNGTITGSLDVTADEVGSSVKDASGKGSTFKQRIDAIMMESKNVSITAEGTLTKEAKDIVTNASNSITEKVGDTNVTEKTTTSSKSEIQNADTITSVQQTENMVQSYVGKKDLSATNVTTNFANASANQVTENGQTSTVLNNKDGLLIQNNANGNSFTTADGTNTGPALEWTNIKGNEISTGKVEANYVKMGYADVMKDLGVRGNAKVGQNLEVGGTSTLKGDVTMGSNATVKNNLNVEGITTTKTLSVTENATVGGTLDVTGKATFKDSVDITNDLTVGGNATIKGDVTAKSYKVGDKTYISADGINANDQKITNVADGSISEGSKDAVNGGQLYGMKTDLEHKVDKVGANAAAMANLHPMEFDPDSKWNIAAAMGNYGSETATAIGAFYRPNEDVMVNFSTAFGTGENMVGGGVSVRLGKGGNKLSREETNALKDQVNDLTARMDALLSVLNPNMSKDFPDVPENHWAYEAVSRLAGNDIVQGYPDGEFHGERTMTRYEMAEIIYNALSRGAEAERELVEEFKPELQAMAASEKATAEKAEG